MNDKMQCVTCPNCGNSDCREDESYCFNCGNPLRNYCTNGNCPMSDEDSGGLRPTDVYCPYCGSQSTFLEAGFISPRSFADEQPSRNEDNNSISG